MHTRTSGGVGGLFARLTSQSHNTASIFGTWSTVPWASSPPRCSARVVPGSRTPHSHSLPALDHATVTSVERLAATSQTGHATGGPSAGQDGCGLGDQPMTVTSVQRIAQVGSSFAVIWQLVRNVQRPPPWPRLRATQHVPATHERRRNDATATSSWYRTESLLRAGRYALRYEYSTA
jgi:hypothetical protein